MTGIMSAKDRAFLRRHRELAKEDERPARGSAEFVEISGEVRRESERAYLFFDGSREAWVPKSQVETAENGLHMPEWLAKDKGFI